MKLWLARHQDERGTGAGTVPSTQYIRQTYTETEKDDKINDNDNDNKISL